MDTYKPAKQVSPIPEPVGEWLRSARGDVLGEGAKTGASPYLLVQGYPMTGFAKLAPDKIELPPAFEDLRRGPYDLGWDLCWDLRLFGPGGEWHAWRHPSGSWYARLFVKHSQVFPRTYPLWGRYDEHQSATGWDCYYEARGHRVWVPSEDSQQSPEMFLCVGQIVDRDASGLAGVVDAAISGFTKTMPKEDLYE